MSEFFFQYGLFTAKALTIIIFILMALILVIIVATSRNKTREIIEIEKINDKFENLQEALEQEILDKEELKKLQKQRKKEEKTVSKQKKDLQTQKPRLFLLHFEGDTHASETTHLRESITALLTVARDHDEVLINLESPGGLVHHYGLAASQLSRIKARNLKLTVAVDLVAASGGYMMACVADRIIAAPFAVVGSIGVLAQVPNFHRLLNKMDVDVEHHTAGEYKTTLTLFGKNTPQGREKFRQDLEKTHDLFKDFVKTHRNQINIDEIANGDHWYASKALDLHLVDEIKTSDDFLLEKSKTMDIFELKYKINRSLREKFDHWIHQTHSRWRFFFEDQLGLFSMKMLKLPFKK